MTPRISSFLVLGICAAVAVSGCRRKKSSAPEAPSPVEVSAAAPPAPAPSTTPAPAQSVTTHASNEAAYIQEMEQTLNDFLAEYIRAKKRTPKDINEMLSLRIITSMPPIPAGKKWVINQQTGKISAQ